MGRSSRILATVAAILAVSLAWATAAVAQSTDPSVNDYQESAPGADGSPGGGGGDSQQVSSGSSSSGGGVTPDTSAPTTAGSDPTSAGSGSSTSTDGSGGSGGSDANQAQSSGSNGGTSASASGDTAADSSSGPGDLVEGVLSAVGSDSDDSGMGFVFPLLLALLAAGGVALFLRRRAN
jgi:hypothetical protein